MFHEDRDIVTVLKTEDKHFAHVFDKHNALHDKIEKEQNHLSDHELETLKKEKLKYKDELYAMIQEYKANSAK